MLYPNVNIVAAASHLVCDIITMLVKDSTSGPLEIIVRDVAMSIR